MKPSVVNAGYLKEDRTKENDKTVYSLHFLIRRTKKINELIEIFARHLTV